MLTESNVSMKGDAQPQLSPPGNTDLQHFEVKRIAQQTQKSIIAYRQW